MQPQVPNWFTLTERAQTAPAAPSRALPDKAHAVVYQIYIKSFCDSNGDGVGDIPGITSKLDYLSELGVDYLWITPFYPSPQKDGGYDISDYKAIDPIYGTLQDFDNLVDAAAEKNIGIMLDMVLCHTSTAHPWFQRALAGDPFYQDFYLWADPKPGAHPEPPTNWQAAFGGSAWEYVPELGKFYLHLHDVSQPDLNWENPEVRRELADVVAFWKARGVAGFRFDVINMISKPEAMVDDTQGLGRKLFADGPHVHEWLQELVATAGIDGMLTVGEMASTTLENCVRYTRPQNHELGMSFSFHHLKVDYANGNKWALQPADIPELRRIVLDWQTLMQQGGGWNAIFWDNHDQPRAITRFGGRTGAGESNTPWEHVGKLLALASITLKGTPYIYQGDELGMTNAGFPSITQFKDVESHNNYAALIAAGATPAEALHVIHERSRDNGRTPVQWSPDHAAGFTTGIPWIEPVSNYPKVNALLQTADKNSLLNFWRTCVALRHNYEVFCTGRVEALDAGTSAPKVICFSRTLDPADTSETSNTCESVVAALSFDEAPCQLDPHALGYTPDQLEFVFGNYDTPAAPGLTLRPYEAAIWAPMR